jgi:hypothetical protein
MSGCELEELRNPADAVAWFCQSVLTPCGANLERGICKWSKELVDLVGIEPTTSSMPFNPD